MRIKNINTMFLQPVELEKKLLKLFNILLCIKYHNQWARNNKKVKCVTKYYVEIIRNF